MTEEAAPIRCVLDASIAIKWYVDEQDSDLARGLLTRITHPDSQTHVPSHFYVEMANVLWVCVRRDRLGRNAAIEAMATLIALNLTPLPIERLSQTALDLSLEHGIAAYDAAYIALSELLQLPLITADDVLWRKLHHRFDILVLS